MDRHQSGRPVHSEVCPTWITVFRFSRCPTAASLLSVFSLLPEMKYVSLINAHPHTRCYTCSPQLTAVGKVKKKKRIRFSQQSRPDCESCLKSFPFKFPRFWQTCWGSCRDNNVWEMWGRRGDDSLPPQYSRLQHVWVREDIQPSGWGGTCDKDEVRRQMRHSVRHDGTWEHVRFLSAKDFGGTRRTDLSQQSSSSTTCFTKTQKKKTQAHKWRWIHATPEILQRHTR